MAAGLSERLMEEMASVARSAVLGAGDLIRDRFGAPSGVQSKGPSDYVTDVDEECEALIIEMIRKWFPDHHVLSEESASSGSEQGIHWIIDPLDGTTNFIHGFPCVAVSVAVYAGQEALLGFVLDPIHQELFTASRNRGAYLNGDPIRVREVASLQEALIATGFPFRNKDLLDPYLASLKAVLLEVSGIRRAGSAALDLAYVASGRVNGFWEAGLKIWDVAAGSLMIQEAGGLVSDFWGTTDYLHNGHIVAGTPLVYPFLLQKLKNTLAPALA